MSSNPRTELATIHEVTAIDQQQMAALAEQLLPKWPKDLNRQTALDVARVALAYQLDPFMEELIPYQGKPYVTIAGRIRIADNHPQFNGYELEPATDSERRALGVHETEAVWKCIVHRKDRTVPMRAFGRAGGPAETNPVARRWLPEIAQKRAIHRALRAAFPLNLPGVEERSSAAQLRAIHAADAEAGIDREARHQALSETFDVESSDELTSTQAGVYLDDRVVESHTEIEVEYASGDDYFDTDGKLLPVAVTGDPARDVPRMLALLEASDTPRKYKQASGYIIQIGLHSDPEIAAIIEERDARLAARRGQGGLADDHNQAAQSEWRRIARVGRTRQQS